MKTITDGDIATILQVRANGLDAKWYLSHSKKHDGRNLRAEIHALAKWLSISKLDESTIAHAALRLAAILPFSPRSQHRAALDHLLQIAEHPAQTIDVTEPAIRIGWLEDAANIVLTSIGEQIASEELPHTIECSSSIDAPTISVTKIDLALATLAKNPEWTAKQIAKQVNMRIDSLLKNKRFKAARAAQKPDMKKSYFDRRTGKREIEDNSNEE